MFPAATNLLYYLKGRNFRGMKTAAKFSRSYLYWPNNLLTCRKNLICQSPNQDQNQNHCPYEVFISNLFKVDKINSKIAYLNTANKSQLYKIR